MVEAALGADEFALSAFKFLSAVYTILPVMIGNFRGGDLRLVCLGISAL
jgi:hypothetical protein